MADRVHIVGYDASWPARFQQIAAELRGALGNTAIRIDHIGSTAIPGLDAKPVIDIQVSVKDFEPFDTIRLPLEKLGYVFRSANGWSPGPADA